MRSLFAYSLLAVQLVLVRLVAAQSTYYAIGNAGTKYWISNTTTAAGDDVQTSAGSDQPPTNALFLTVEPPVDPSSFDNHTIHDEYTGLYVGLEQPFTPGSRLKWVPDLFEWIILKAQSKDTSGYVIFPSGQNYFWYDNATTPNVIEVDNVEHQSGIDFLWEFHPSN